jgi:hypothetical protein
MFFTDLSIMSRSSTKASFHHAAQKVGPSVLFAAVNAANLEDSLALAEDSDRGRRYMRFLAEFKGEKYLKIITGLENEPYLFVLLEDGGCRFLEDISIDEVGRSAEGIGLLNLSVIGEAIVTAAARPLFTVNVPASFK